MCSDVFFTIFACTGGLHLLFIFFDCSKGRQVTKILLMPFLILWTYSIHPIFLLLLALFYGWVGDVLLLRKEQHIFLKLGLLSFLLGHISYISIFSLHTYILPNTVIVVATGGLYALFGWGMFQALRAGLGRMAFPVGIYIFAISIMSFSALVFAHSNGGMAWWAFAGSLLFVFSDSVLALQLFRKPFKSGRFLVMVSYIPAQFLLAFGILNL